ncbi:bifunctional ornithine acetyltransferase/N-acetylglutamate synthase [Spirochaeta thermophila]|uniref:Arginine biosynthesis bifunctional protein ArgJ n=1 Tax=Winmispira thermophila (strain ATCC 49972 / DSM 6192 / RI 19.B1) TaxID=665571 RepID=E0RNM9_WINT6|nr:bifunctional ornithine acetyltransferase/N-acetylglutamate synthase [Spirochaeta thermophila]ADN02620.1 arginine biosynthesis bifunctional protein ArgJ [Spirochaeta thermophila DSM 6192]
MTRWWSDLVFSSKEEYEGFCRRYAQLPEGVRASTVRFGFAPVERPDRQLLMDLSLVVLDEPTVRWAARFTSSAFPGVPVRIGRAMQGRPIQGFVINNRIANVGTAHGEEYALRVRERVGEAVGIDPGLLVPSSTGIIGWELPVERMCEEAGRLAAGLGSADGVALARAIMTTDAYPKLCAVPVGEGMLWGMAKGAGMIEPHLATMLVFLFTDVEVDPEVLDGTLGEVVDRTFNCISVDGDQSTSDSVFLVSTARRERVGEGEFREALERVCGFLAEQVVRNGEGTGHVVRVEVRGWDDEVARGVGKAVVNSPLFKTAIAGCDPNVGRVLSAAGAWLGRRGVGMRPEGVRVWMADQVVFEKGRFLLDREKEVLLSSYLRATAMEPSGKVFPPHQGLVDVRLEYEEGEGRAVVLGSDLTVEYVHINADYRS